MHCVLSCVFCVSLKSHFNESVFVNSPIRWRQRLSLCFWTTWGLRLLGPPEGTSRNTPSGPCRSVSLRGDEQHEAHTHTGMDLTWQASSHLWIGKSTWVCSSTRRPQSRRARRWAWWPCPGRTPPAQSTGWSTATPPRTACKRWGSTGSPANHRQKKPPQTNSFFFSFWMLKTTVQWTISQGTDFSSTRDHIKIYKIVLPLTHDFWFI